MSMLMAAARAAADGVVAGQRSGNAGALAGRGGSFAGDLATEVTKKLIEKGAENYAKKKEEAAKAPPQQTFAF
ncbi:hypothetical protein, partial [Laribacter hongkongensis]|uniref:hypothetical protein n=2 Tax=Laribacter hongkongensis TaxID=168471 RepID=UPI001EFD38AB